MKHKKATPPVNPGVSGRWLLGELEWKDIGNSIDQANFKVNQNRIYVSRVHRVRGDAEYTIAFMFEEGEHRIPRTDCVTANEVLVEMVNYLYDMEGDEDV